jgi:hypothetical protein
MMIALARNAAIVASVRLWAIRVKECTHVIFWTAAHRPSVTAATAMLAYAPRIGLSRSALISSVVGSRPSRRAPWLWFLLGLPSIPPVWRSGCSFALGALLHLALQQMPRLRTGRGTHGRYAFRVSAICCAALSTNLWTSRIGLPLRCTMR